MDLSIGEGRSLMLACLMWLMWRLQKRKQNNNTAKSRDTQQWFWKTRYGKNRSNKKNTRVDGDDQHALSSLEAEGQRKSSVK